MLGINTKGKISSRLLKCVIGDWVFVCDKLGMSACTAILQKEETADSGSLSVCLCFQGDEMFANDYRRSFRDQTASTITGPQR